MASSYSSAWSCREGYAWPGGPDISKRDFEPNTAAASEAFLDAVLRGFERRPRSVPNKYLYDERGSQLFDEICDLDEYYPTRTELGILRDSADEISEIVGAGSVLLEYGSGSSLKTRVLLDTNPELAAYVPVDISREHLLSSAESLRKRYPGLQVLPLCADYTADHSIPATEGRRTVVFFPGSTIGNFEPDEAVGFLKHMSQACGAGGGILIGVDLHKNTEVLEAAYDDARGVSAAFALNLLERMNRELGADFDLKRFGYDAYYDEAARRIVMSIESLEDQQVRIGSESFELEEGEQLRTEYSYKYSLEDFQALVTRADLGVRKVWTDAADLFSVQYLTPL